MQLGLVSPRWWTLTALLSVAAFVVGLAVSRSDDSQVPHFVPEAVPIEGYAVATGDDRDLRFFALLGEGDQLDVPSITEAADHVTVRLVSFRFMPARGGFKNLAGYHVQTRAILREPLGTRAVIDAKTGQAVPRGPAEP